MRPIAHRGPRRGVKDGRNPGVWKAGLLTTVQDFGRRAYAHLGVLRNGAIDGYALRWAQRLAGLPPTVSALEITLFGPTLEVMGETYAALAGAELRATLNGWPFPSGETRNLRTGDAVDFLGADTGLRAYLAFGGGPLGGWLTHP